jgi:hypothetical protein
MMVTANGHRDSLLPAIGKGGCALPSPRAVVMQNLTT